SLLRDGTAFTFDTPICMPDRAAGIYRAPAGARWHNIIGILDRVGFSPAVMQSNADFGVASTFSVNAHGWAVPHGPFGSTVRSLRMLMADGALVTCSRTQEPDLFRHVMGGYGLFGVILDLDVEMVPNVTLVPTFEPVDAKDFARPFLAVCTDPKVNMAYGRLDVSRDNFLEHALLISYRPDASGAPPRPLKVPGVASALTHRIYRAEVGSDFAKRFRWFMETTVGPRMSTGPISRNTILDDPVSALAGHNPKRTDILHEYFMPPERFPDFLTACREVILKSHQELLNVTLRFLAPDTESVLAYAPTRRISAVMSFSQWKTAEAEADMQQMTRNLIDRVQAIGGSFYLPYRLHETREQLAKSYPAIDSFVAAKRHYDPGLLFRNALWNKYLAAPTTGTP
ncbi:MAG TPA: FAD-binding oxidoreductase, partial [Alphaproteobacteria bacterium]|nr:FAD-binding oxidoreductase [Alphaproteobacteria bacterium]